MGKEKVGLTEVELEIMRLFAGHGQFNDGEIASDLSTLAIKLTLQEGETG